MHFVSGNHEDFAWLGELHAAAGQDVVPIDPLGLFHHVADGTVLDLGGLRVAFLGRIDAPGMRFDLDADAYARLLALEPGSVELLVTHDNPLGVPPSRITREGGSRRLTQLVERLEPALHVCGHIHQVHGPRVYGPTRSYTLTLLVPPKHDRWSGDAINPEQRVAGGSIAIADTESGCFEYVHDDWLAQIAGDELQLTEHLRA